MCLCVCGGGGYVYLLDDESGISMLVLDPSLLTPGLLSSPELMSLRVGSYIEAEAFFFLYNTCKHDNIIMN